VFEVRFTISIHSSAVDVSEPPQLTSAITARGVAAACVGKGDKVGMTRRLRRSPYLQEEAIG
jgi:hypothetical protein